jgi:hypothetical protein
MDPGWSGTAWTSRPGQDPDQVINAGTVQAEWSFSHNPAFAFTSYDVFCLNNNNDNDGVSRTFLSNSAISPANILQLPDDS